MLLGRTQTEKDTFQRGYHSFIPKKLQDRNKGQDIVVVWNPDQILPFCVIHKAKYPETLEFCAPKKRTPEELEEFRLGLEGKLWEQWREWRKSHTG